MLRWGLREINDSLEDTQKARCPVPRETTSITITAKASTPYAKIRIVRGQATQSDGNTTNKGDDIELTSGRTSAPIDLPNNRNHLSLHHEHHTVFQVFVDDVKACEIIVRRTDGKVYSPTKSFHPPFATPPSGPR